MAEQLPLNLPVRAALGREDFVVSGCNEMAVAALDDVSAWPDRKLVLSGVEGAGKTHLVHVWAQDVMAHVVDAGDLVGLDVHKIAVGPVAVEDIDKIAGDCVAETALFHLHNTMLAGGHLLLMTSEVAPARLSGSWWLSLRCWTIPCLGSSGALLPCRRLSSRWITVRLRPNANRG